MGIEFVRGSNGRCPSFMVCGLSVMCLFLLCNWWSLSSQNIELRESIEKQNEDFILHIKINREELDKCTLHKTELDERLKLLQDSTAQQRVQMERLKATDIDLRGQVDKDEEELGNMKKKSEAADSALKICNIELESLKKVGQSKDSTLETLRTENKDLLKNMNEKDEKIKELEETIALFKNKPNPKMLPNILHKIAKNNDKPVQDGVAIGGNHDAAAALDENNAAEKNDNDGGAPQEQEPGATAQT